MPELPEDDRSIDGSDRCYRRIPPSQAPYNENRGRRWPSSGNLTPSKEDTEVSIYLGSVLDELHLLPEDVLEGHEGYGLSCFPAQAARDANFGIKRDPVTESNRPLKVDPAHAVLTGLPPTGKPAIKRARKLVYDERLIVVREPDAPEDLP
ncbi:hypothetical protein FHU28_000378 [Micromonospora echinospora]|uniref:Uncharacterized protein n=1 Tax=Micromonospora echinospora TaxID=1877 RepID=A0ABR6M639_MICEC|nr:hypothetical protein [Micromonospora echinospora]MBB5110539.1 hypothetical protein [Micromonospora echinospora]